MFPPENNFSRRPILLTTLLVLLFVLLLQTTPTTHPGTRLNPELVIKSSQTKQTSVAIAGSKTPVQWTTLIKKSDISSNSYLTKLPKHATNIKIQTISANNAKIVLSAKVPTATLAMSDRRTLALRKPSPANSWLGSLSDAAESITSALGGPASGGDPVIVDLSEQIPSGQPVDPITPELATDSADMNSIATDSGDTTNYSLPTTNSSDFVSVTYETPAPTITEEETSTGKTVTVSDPSETQTPTTDVLAFTNIPEIYKLGQEDKIKIKWKSNGDQPMEFHAYDLNNNGKLDYVEWTVPHLSDQVFEIIFISKAWHLDSNQEILADIYDQVATQEGTYEENTFATIPTNDFIRVTFQQTLTSSNDITLYARPSVIPAEAGIQIEVYPVYMEEQGNQTQGPKLDLVSDGTNPDFTNITEASKYRILLTNLQTPTDVFDLKVVCTDTGCLSGIEIDYIVDPVPTYTWTERYPPGGTPEDRFWYVSASDSTGTNLIAGIILGRLYISANSGVSWAETQPAGNFDRAWYSAASDSDGSNLIVASNWGYDGVGRLYTSANYGVDWTERYPPGGTPTDKSWESVASDSDGSFLIAAVSGGRIYTSSNYGVDWTERYPPGGTPANKNWISVASDSDGSNLITAFNSGRLYTSSNGGIDWTERYPPGGTPTNKTWQPVASDSTGLHLVAGIYLGRLYTSSNGGVDWTERQPAGDTTGPWAAAAYDSTGTNLVVSKYNRLYISPDSGASWSETQPAGNFDKAWRSVAFDSGGSNLIAGGSAPGRLYTGVLVTNTAPTLTSVATTPATVKGGSTLTITPAGQADTDSNDLYYYCNETGTAGGAAPTSANTLCTQEPTAYASASYTSMTCSYTADTGNATRNVYCRAYDSTEYSDEVTTTYIVDSTAPTTTISSTNNANNITSTLTCNDGSATTYYCTDTTNTCTPTTVYTTPVTYPITQTTYFRYYSTDTAGNQSSTGSSLVSAIEGQASEPVRAPAPGQVTPPAPEQQELDPIEQIKQQIIDLISQLVGLFAEQVKQMAK